MHNMKDYNKMIKSISKNPNFEIDKTGRKSTIKVIHKETRNMYSVHPGDKAVFPLLKWIKKFN